MTKKYTPTGFPIGRPRVGEIRPLTPKTIAARKYRAENREYLNEAGRYYSAAWRAANPEHTRELARNAARRSKAYQAWMAEHNASALEIEAVMVPK